MKLDHRYFIRQVVQVFDRFQRIIRCILASMKYSLENVSYSRKYVYYIRSFWGYKTQWQLFLENLILASLF